MEPQKQEEAQVKIKRPLWYKIVFYTCFFGGLLAMAVGPFTSDSRFSSLATGLFLAGMVFTIAAWRQVEAR